MKNNKKGFTLIEIIIAIVLIALIGTISIVTLTKKNKTENEEQIAYLEDIKLDATVYYENNKKEPKFSWLKYENDATCIRISDLIAEGILAAEKYNPYTKKESGKQDAFIKIFIDADNNINVEYQEDEKFCGSLKIPDDKKARIVLENNNEEANILYLNSSKDMFYYLSNQGSKVYNLNDVIENIQIGHENIYSEKELFKNYKDYFSEGFKLQTTDGEILETTPDDWGIYMEILDFYSEEDDEDYYAWCFKYYLKKENIKKKYPRVEISDHDYSDDIIYDEDYNIIDNNVRIVTLGDNDAPVLLKEDGMGNIVEYEYSTYPLRAIYSISEGKYDFNLAYQRAIGDKYFVFDNYDGLEENIKDNYFSELAKTAITMMPYNHKLIDTHNNKREYKLNIEYIKNQSPIIRYKGSDYVKSSEIYWDNPNGWYGIYYIYPFYENIELYDPDGDAVTLEGFSLCRTNKILNGLDDIENITEKIDFILNSKNKDNARITITFKDRTAITVKASSITEKDEKYIYVSDPENWYGEKINIASIKSIEEATCYYRKGNNNLEEFLPGLYTLHLTAYDTSREYTKAIFSIYIDYEYNPECTTCSYVPSTDNTTTENICGIICQMHINSMNYNNTTSEEERQRLHDENIRLSEQLPYEVEYSPLPGLDGYWTYKTADGNIALLYDPASNYMYYEEGQVGTNNNDNGWYDYGYSSGSGSGYVEENIGNSGNMCGNECGGTVEIPYNGSTDGCPGCW